MKHTKSSHYPFFKKTLWILTIVAGASFGASPALAADDPACVGKAPGYFWSSTASNSATATCGSNNLKEVCTSTYSNFCFGGKTLSIPIIKSCSSLKCEKPASTATPAPAPKPPIVISAPIPVPPPVVITTPSPVVTAPSASVPATPKPPVVVAAPVPAPATSAPVVPPPVVVATPAPTTPVVPKLVIGVNAHNAWTGPALMYPEAEEETVFKLLNKNNIRSYRVDVETSSRAYAVLTRLVALGKKYNVVIRPMLYVNANSENEAYLIAKKFSPDIKLWELGNELNLKGVENYTGNINLMIKARKGVMRAAAETGQKLQTSINVTSGLYDVGLNNAFTSYPFLDKAISMGLQFDYITYHYYPSAGDVKSGWAKRYLDPLRQYGKKVLFNETNCAQIYQGDDGDSVACAQTVDDILTYVRQNYADMIIEINLYELLDNKGIQGPEGHFGLMFDLNRPKKSFDIVLKHAAK